MADEAFGPESKVVQVFAASRVNAEMVRALLEGSGVPAITRGGYSGQYPVNVGGLGEAQVLVREEDEGRAREIISRGDEGELTLDDDALPRWSVTRIALVAIATAVLIALAFGVIVDAMP